jgi:hypothetical protein
MSTVAVDGLIRLIVVRSQGSCLPLEARIDLDVRACGDMLAFL